MTMQPVPSTNEIRDAIDVFARIFLYRTPYATDSQDPVAVFDRALFTLRAAQAANPDTTLARTIRELLNAGAAGPQAVATIVTRLINLTTTQPPPADATVLPFRRPCRPGPHRTR